MTTAIATDRRTTGAVVIRPLTDHDLDAAVGLDAAVHHAPWSRSVLAAELHQPSRRYFGALQDVRLVAFGGTLLAVDEVHVTTLVVDPRQHRRKLATRLLVRMLDDAVARGATSATLEVRATNRGAQRLYTAFGFAPVAVRAGYYDGTPDPATPNATGSAAGGRREDAIIMWAYDITGLAYARRLDQQRTRCNLPGGSSGAPDLPVPHVADRVGLQGSAVT